MGSAVPFKPALVVVDFQEDFCPPHGALAVPDGRSIAPVVNRMLALPFALKVATRDWHPRDHVSFAANHAGAAPFTSTHTIRHPLGGGSATGGRGYGGCGPATDTTRLWPVHCVAGTPGAQFAREMDAGRVDVVLDKGTDARVEMYSAFRDPFGVSESGLEGRLAAEGVTDVYVVGLALDYCVRATAADAARCGFRVWVVREGTRMIDEAERARVEEELGWEGPVMVSEDGEEVRWVEGWRR
ncbi:Nicotinamidase [Escovopsis weberi]|uniref:nicotinamidase n=1 Tax=Escovopsis weberi TaxID=150374 RepID=A0A0M8N518_ESCWE|nr:Nicotinamidase [Escovopsis weberi]